MARFISRVLGARGRTLSIYDTKCVINTSVTAGSILSGNTLTAGAVRLELSSRQVFVQERPVALTPKEYALLLCLLQNRNTVLSREQLLVKCWGYDYEGEARAVDTHIRRLRDKLGSAADMIKTVIKSGYKLEV